MKSLDAMAARCPARRTSPRARRYPLLKGNERESAVETIDPAPEPSPEASAEAPGAPAGNKSDRAYDAKNQCGRNVKGSENRQTHKDDEWEDTYDPRPS
jgi:hypothetical protein